MTTRPKIKLPLSWFDKQVEQFGWIVLVMIWIVAVWGYFSLPETIPVHFNAAGEADGFGNKTHIWVLPLATTLLYAGMSIINRYPHLHCYTKEITPDNAEKEYTESTKLIRYSKLIVLLLLGALLVKTVLNSLNLQMQF